MLLIMFGVASCPRIAYARLPYSAFLAHRENGFEVVVVLPFPRRVRLNGFTLLSLNELVAVVYWVNCVSVTG